MKYKTVKLDEDNYRFLVREASVLQQKYGVKVSLNDALSGITKRNNQSLMKYAGCISAETAKIMKDAIADMRSKDK